MFLVGELPNDADRPGAARPHRGLDVRLRRALFRPALRIGFASRFQVSFIDFHDLLTLECGRARCAGRRPFGEVCRRRTGSGLHYRCVTFRPPPDTLRSCTAQGPVPRPPGPGEQSRRDGTLMNRSRITITTLVIAALAAQRPDRSAPRAPARIGEEVRRRAGGGRRPARRPPGRLTTSSRRPSATSTPTSATSRPPVEAAEQAVARRRGEVRAAEARVAETRAAHRGAPRARLRRRAVDVYINPADDRRQEQSSTPRTSARPPRGRRCVDTSPLATTTSSTSSARPRTTWWTPRPRAEDAHGGSAEQRQAAEDRLAELRVAQEEQQRLRGRARAPHRRRGRARSTRWPPRRAGSVPLIAAETVPGADRARRQRRASRLGSRRLHLAGSAARSLPGTGSAGAASTPASTSAPPPARRSAAAKAGTGLHRLRRAATATAS